MHRVCALHVLPFCRVATARVIAVAVKLMRFVTIRDKLGHSKQFTDTVAMQRYEGVPALSNATRNMPLPLVTSKGTSRAYHVSPARARVHWRSRRGTHQRTLLWQHVRDSFPLHLPASSLFVCVQAS